MGGRRWPGPTLREVCSPLIPEDLAPLVPEHTAVQISSRLTDDDFRQLAEFMADYPDVGHPTLRDGTWGLCSDRKNIAAWDLLPLGEPPFNHPKSTAPDRFRQPR